MSVVNITLKIFRFRTFAYKSDNQRSVENFTLEIFRLHTFACKCDNWRSVEKINFRLHTLLHCFACKSDNWRSVEKIDFRLHTLLHSFACKSDNWRSVGNITLEIPTENTPIQSITRSARATWPILDMLGLEISKNRLQNWDSSQVVCEPPHCKPRIALECSRPLYSTPALVKCSAL